MYGSCRMAMGVSPTYKAPTPSFLVSGGARAGVRVGVGVRVGARIRVRIRVRTRVRVGDLGLGTGLGWEHSLVGG